MKRKLLAGAVCVAMGLGLLQVFAPSTAMAQWVAAAITSAGGTLFGPLVSSSYFRSTAGNGQPAFVMDTTGARICFNGPTCTAYWASAAGSTVSGNMIPSFGRYEASATTLAYQAGSVTSGNNAYSVGINGARFDTGTGTNDFLASDGTAVTTAGYGVGPGTAGQFAGAPTAADCDADAERGRIAIDTTNNRLYICNGGTRLWDYVALTD